MLHQHHLTDWTATMRRLWPSSLSSPERIFVMGHSAGAHLAALVATDDRHLKAEHLPLATIKGVILLDGAG